MAIALGVAAATAVLTGALLVGESMRTSLRELTLNRLGEIDDLVVSRGFFNQNSLVLNQGTRWKTSVPAILFNNGTVESESADGSPVQRATNVNVFGVPQEFWELDSGGLQVNPLSGETCIVNQELADQLGLDHGAKLADLTLRIPKPTQLPAESALGATRDLIESLPGLKVAQVLPNDGLAGFSLHQSQLDSPNIFVPIELLQDALSRKALKHKSTPDQANVCFLKRTEQSNRETAELDGIGEAKRTLEDEGLLLKRATGSFGEGDQAETIFDYWTLSSDQLVLRRPVVQAIESAFPNSKPVFTYLANDIRKDDAPSGVPFSMVAAIDIDDSFPLQDSAGKRIEALGEDEIVLNEWAAENLQASVGDRVFVSWFDPETTHGKQSVEEANFVVSAIAALTEPSEPFQTRRRGQIVPAKFDAAPTLANDADLTPEVPGVTDAQSIENWDLPFETASKLRPEDDAYWDNHRTTPKAFVALNTGQRLWNSRFGKVTSFRIPADVTEAEIQSRLLKSIAATDGASGFDVVQIRDNALSASSGSTPFDALFLALSMFVIASGLILVSLLFRLTCLLYTSPSPRDQRGSRMPSSA